MPDLLDSRRFYVHEHSFRMFATAFPRWSSHTIRVLGLALGSRIAWHHLIDAGEAMNLVPVNTFAPQVSILHGVAMDEATNLFHRLVFAPSEATRYGSTERLLYNNETVCATCWESGYFTFATSEDAAKIMFEETGSLRGLRCSLRDASIHLDCGLELVSGKQQLFVVASEIGWGKGTLRSYRTLARESGIELPAPAGSTGTVPTIESLVGKWNIPETQSEGTEVELLREARSAIERGVAAMRRRLGQLE